MVPKKVYVMALLLGVRIISMELPPQKMKETTLGDQQKLDLRRAMREAIDNKDIQAALRLIDTYPDYYVNHYSSFGQSLLNAAIKGNLPQIIQKLIQNGVNINKPDEMKEIPLVLAFSAQDFRLISQMLVDAGANINLRLNANETLLFWAIRNADIDRIDFLLQNHADPFLKNDQGMSALDLIRSVQSKNKRDQIRVLFANYGFGGTKQKLE
jgi:ankyrin repeat protein